MSEEKGINLIIADDDPDGLTSTRQVVNYLDYKKKNYTYMFTDWKAFGIDTELFTAKGKQIGAPIDTVYFLDIGSGLEDIHNAMKIGENIKAKHVLIADNHPPSKEEPGFQEWADEVMSINDDTNTQVYSTTESCTAGMIWEYLNDKEFRTEWNDRWALIGLDADVAIDKPQGKKVADILFKDYPELKGEVMTPKKETNGWGYWRRPILGAVAHILHNPRRIAYSEGTAMTYSALEEIEKYGDLMRLLTLKSDSVPVGFPNIRNILKYNEQWEDRFFKEVFSGGRSQHIDYGLFGITVFNHEWNCGSAACNIQSKEKPWMAINLGTPEFNHISGRVGRDRKSNVTHAGNFRDWFGALSKVSNGQINGGGIKEAGSALAPKTYTVQQMINLICKAVSTVEGESWQTQKKQSDDSSETE
jgi:hypothetical protein